MNAQKLQSYFPKPHPLRCFEALDSTNTHARVWAARGAPHGAAVFADEQSKGRGRRGRAFCSPKGGLYMSLVVENGRAAPGQLTTLAAVAALEAVEEVTGQRLMVKWVNDLIFEGQKVAGILAEGVIISGALAKSVIGIGLNLGPAELPVPGAGTLYREGFDIDRERLGASIVNRILEGLPQAPRHMASYRDRCLTLGQWVAFEYENQPRSGLAEGIDDEGALMVKTDGGVLRLIAGEVSVKPSGQERL
ncbi:MAG: biotin--[acetyl-CoA-carboxylase] ligase [Eubacteriales bacterium]|mgnify:FL=1|jgi:BirA family biotin operon repressor/biotin-[acetyl-CoA-carboxylase] ligase|nr:biotin--[acetyl-CoA-carboxylase] ligase [Eubacteriales bacterium]MDD4134349.1 biotin--[acetyl-CoA-carboxylase] ligase [Eubacteriales bacterium]NLO14079.1 biotin--[acetyl-CoA-carboxylase] ligase [Clostridiales bacterium]